MTWSVTNTKIKEYSSDKNWDKSKQIWQAYNETLDVTIPLMIYAPIDIRKCHKVIFSIHGRHRNGKYYRKLFTNIIRDSDGVMVIAPVFRDKKYQRSLALNMGNMINTIKKQKTTVDVPENQWTFCALDEIFKILTKKYPNLKNYSIFGHSAGAQFAHRMAIFYNSNNLDRVVAVNPGWFTLIDNSIEFPYGIGDLFSNNKIKKILAKNVTIIAGEKDNQPDKYTRKTKRAVAQGKNRFEKAVNAIKVAQSTAEMLGTKCNWKLVKVKDLSHSPSAAAKVAVKYLGI